MKMNVISKTLVSAVIGLTAGVALNASADTYGETLVTTSAEGLQQITVAYDDLDLSSARAQETLHYRISRAAEAVCGPTNPRAAGGITQATENKQCYEAAMSDAMSQMTASQVASTAK